jgi:cleavage stimulation factor subunit 3
MTDFSAELHFLRALKVNSAVPAANIQQQLADDEEEDDYDPSSFVAPSKPSIPTAQAPLVSAPTKQPFFKAGFQIDEDDDEDGVEHGNGQLSVAHVADNKLNGNMSTTAGVKRSSSGTPLNTAVSVPNVSISHAEEKNSLNTPTPSYLEERAPSNPTPLPKSPAQSNAHPTMAEPSSATTSFFPKQRLPQDRVGILEDRIAEDSRGDIDAWLELIAENRSRGRLDQAREVYQRFFKLFPTAVSARRCVSRIY